MVESRIEAERAEIDSQLAQMSKYAIFTKTTNQSITDGTAPEVIWEQKQSFNGEDFSEIEAGRIKITKAGKVGRL